MGHTLWIQTRSGSEFFGESDDLSSLCRYSDLLDKLCKKAKAIPISNFIDNSYVISCHEGEDGDLEDPITGLSVGLEEMEWYNLEEGISTLNTLHQILSESKIRGLSDSDSLNIQNDIRYCLERLRSSENMRYQFNLEVIP